MKKTHGKSKTKIYRIWSTMKERCYNPNNWKFPLYGQKGIQVCDRWKNSFQNFSEDMGERPEGKFSLDRIDVRGNYTPENCKWSTDTEQARNRTSTRYVESEWGLISLAEASERSGMNYGTLKSRLRAGYTGQDVFNKHSFKTKKLLK